MIGSLFHHLWVESEWMDTICNLNESSIDMSENKNVVRLSVKNFVHCNNKCLGKVPWDERRCRSDGGAGEGSTIDGHTQFPCWMMAARDLTETINRCTRSDGGWTTDTRDEWWCRSDRGARRFHDWWTLERLLLNDGSFRVASTNGGDRWYEGKGGTICRN